MAGGNNSAYGFMGDGASLSYYYGWKRPSAEASPIISDTIMGDYSVRAPSSMYLTQWLDAQGFAYDVYSDNDFDIGLITADDYRALAPNSHHEYWSDGMLATLTQFLDDGGSVVAPAGNIFTWRVVYGENQVVEARKFRKVPVLGLADMQSGIDGLFSGGLGGAAICNGSDQSYYGSSQHKALGVVIHATRPCTDRPFCFGQWEIQNSDHWLWQGSGLSNGDFFGQGRAPDTFAVGHEMDTWAEGMPLPGLAAGQQPVILGEGTKFDPSFPTKGTYPAGHPLSSHPIPTSQTVPAGRHRQ